MEQRPTNRELAATDLLFREACAAAGVYPSRTRYRKYKHRQGKAYAVANSLIDNRGQNGINLQTK